MLTARRRFAQRRFSRSIATLSIGARSQAQQELAAQRMMLPSSVMLGRRVVVALWLALQLSGSTLADVLLPAMAVRAAGSAALSRNLTCASPDGGWLVADAADVGFIVATAAITPQQFINLCVFTVGVPGGTAALQILAMDAYPGAGGEFLVFGAHHNQARTQALCVAAAAVPTRSRLRAPQAVALCL